MPPVFISCHDMSSARIPYLTALAAALGLIGGGAAWLLLHLIAVITNVALYHRVGWSLPPTSTLEPGITLLPVAVAGGIIVAAMARVAPIIRGHGIPEAMESILLRQSRIAPVTALFKPISAAVAIGTGGPFGAEGPIIVTGGATGSLLGQILPVSPAERKILLAAGAAAGMSATFGAPLASVVLAFELLLFEFSRRALLPVATAAAVAAGVHYLLLDSGPLFAVPPHAIAGLGSLPGYAVLGLLCGGLAVVVVRGLLLVEHGFRRSGVPEFWHPAIGAVVFATVGLMVPRALGVGYDVIGDALLANLGLRVALILLVGKLIAWWFALGSGTSGGTLAPMLIVGSTFGTVVALGTNDWTPVEVSITGFALVGMAASFGAATGASLTSIVFVFELTQDYRIVLPLIVATVLADVVADALLDDTLMTEKLTRRGVRVVRDYQADPFVRQSVGDVMTAPALTVRANTPIAEVMRYVAAGAHSAYPVVDDLGRCRGIISRTDLLARSEAEPGPAVDVASQDVVTVAPEASVAQAMELLIDESVEHLPVVNGDGVVIGMCTRTDILRARALQRTEEERQGAGLLSSLIPSGRRRD